ncbi:MAG: hypothetical protein Q9186_006951 [Xanthomendoza sp. 1 TL-2023]
MAAPDMKNTGVSVFYPSEVQAATNLLNATIFTRINVLGTPQVVTNTLESTPTIRQTFCLGHLNDILIFDGVKDEHTFHVRSVLQMLIDKGLKAAIRSCAFNKDSWTEAGFHIEQVGGSDKKAFMRPGMDHMAIPSQEEKLLMEGRTRGQSLQSTVEIKYMTNVGDVLVLLKISVAPGYQYSLDEIR